MIMKKVNLILIGYVLLTFMVFLSSHTKDSEITITSEVKNTTEETDFSEEKLVNYIKELNIRFPHIVLAQAKLETGNFKSRLFRENNNLFGMKCATKRPFIHKGEHRGHAKYDRWQDCVIDYALYQAAYLSDKRTESEYFDYLSGNYAEDTNYIITLKRIIISSR